MNILSHDIGGERLQDGFHQSKRKIPRRGLSQHVGGEELPKWTEDNRSVQNTSLVVWYVMGQNHLARLEDWPVMPACNIGFSLKPSGFFARNPSLDVPPQRIQTLSR